ncbi:hypothetical protein B0H19DRAFT_1180733, partial [Mycena capillaripes]
MSDLKAGSPLSLVDPAQSIQINELLRSHLPPPPHLPSTLSTLADELARYDIEIAKVQEKLDRLLADRAVVHTHYTNCSSVLAPIRRLPSEILVEIFGLCWDSFTPAIDEVDSATTSLHTEIERLAHAPLLTLSQVCVRWHSIALGTPALWCQIDLEAELWTAPTHLDSIMGLLRSALERSADHALSLTVSSDRFGVPPHPPALELLAQHSARWQTASFMCPFSALLPLSGLKAKLPHLQSLGLHCWGERPPVFDILQDLPCLKRVEFNRNLDIGLLSQLPLEQLTEVWCVGMIEVDELPVIATLMHRLSRGTKVRFEFWFPEDRDPENDFVFGGPSVTSDIAALVIEVCDFLPLCGQRMLGALLPTFTLPSLKGITFTVGDRSEHLPPAWPLSQFHSLAERSAFDSHLHDLFLDHVTISEVELVQSLAALPSLKRLSVSDHPQLPLDGSVEQV